MNPKFLKLIKEIAFYSSIRSYFFLRYSYNFTPPQLCFFCKCIEDTRDINGSIAEIGCFSGYTTVFLNRYMEAQNIQKKYYAIDTFSGFVTKDIQYEIVKRGKVKNFYTGFQDNKKKWFELAMQLNNFTSVNTIKADVNKFDLRQIGSLSFSLLDVDLYRPMKKSLQELYEILSPGGIIVVDDCDSSNILWDGSDQAYKEFMKEIDQPINIVHGKLGIIKKPV